MSATTHSATPASIRQKFLKGFSLYAVTDVLIRMKGFILMPILTRVLGTVNYGVWAQVGTSVGMVASVGNLGIGGAMYRYLPGLPRERLRREFWMGIVSVTGSVVVFASPFLIFANPVAAAFFGGGENAIYVILGSFLMISSALRHHLDHGGGGTG